MKTLVKLKMTLKSSSMACTGCRCGRASSKHTAEVDGSYSWLVAMASFFGHVMIYGVIWSSGVFFGIFREMFDCSSKTIALLATLSTAFTFGISPISGLLINRFGIRIITVLGGFVAGCGLVLSSFAQHVEYLMATFGIVTGIGFGMAYLSIISIVPLYFTRNRTIALGLAVSGVGIGTFVYPPLIRFLVNSYGVRGSLLITGAITLNLCVCGVIMRNPRVSHRKRIASGTPSEDTESFEVSETMSQTSPLKPSNLESHHSKSSCLKLLNTNVFKNGPYVALCFNNFLIMFGISIVYVHIAAYSETKNVSKDTAAMLVSALGISNFVGRPIFGFLAKIPYFQAHILYASVMCVCGLGVSLIPVMNSFYGILVLASLFGLLSACIGPLIPQLIVDFLSVEMIPSAYGYLLLFESLGSLLGPPAAGWLHDGFEYYPASFYLGGASLFLSGVILLPSYVYERLNKKSHLLDNIAGVIDVDCSLEKKQISV